MIVLVTGATAGFGLAITQKFVAAGHRVIAAGRRQARLADLQASLGDAVYPLVLDVSDRQAVATALTSLPAAWQAIDILVNNAGLALGLEPAHRASLDDWETMVDTNIKGLLYCTRLVLPGMVERGRGHVINIGSTAGEWPYPGGNTYGATKAFVYQFSMNLRADLLGTPVRVTDVEPGLCGGTEFSNVRFHGDDSKAAKVYEGTQPLTAEDIAETVYWVASRPAHVNVNSIQLMPVCQAFSPLAVHRG
ncbi:bifunctional NADP-dependent 3-hydroxy acid dehydrogenase/3-hydroxypropionate dehydrogenase YdfG [Parvibium lacunae]|uniref:Bifunctional NADP-dependent 3-hydroxy acid dehydrogenase/3-hydroxypropionate dehydrogenase YdfG n=1 Tax=Parvibium lacunae TaxID=1888893 RepID=A0A368L0D1_9BURK|nr:bifunctional NADP-dependent 3-hydroxy acid dehydrogenase/3-hydroxypropionate dehydrogenase YdfG [Parvibium lacunae]RCS56529.1 bifunctional NADP-dependent 3-hydroxy acid dehydrogenase/3-hydroxypropionate dehydrogenase YdfG [Parvibium lacunae]